MIYLLPTPGTPERLRFGLSVSRKIGGAVVRNRVKRLLREAARQLECGFPPGHDAVFVARGPIRDVAGLGQVRESMERILGRVGRDG